MNENWLSLGADQAAISRQLTAASAVLARSVAGRVSHTAVFGELPEGRYELYLRPAGPVALTVAVRGGEVTEADWPL